MSKKIKGMSNATDCQCSENEANIKEKMRQWETRNELED